MVDMHLYRRQCIDPHHLSSWDITALYTYYRSLAPGIWRVVFLTTKRKEHAKFPEDSLQLFHSSTQISNSQKPIKCMFWLPWWQVIFLKTAWQLHILQVKDNHWSSGKTTVKIMMQQTMIIVSIKKQHWKNSCFAMKQRITSNTIFDVISVPL